MRNKFFFGIIIIFSCAGIATIQARDGYDLWLGYEPLSDLALTNIYREQCDRLVVCGTSPICHLIREELQQGLAQLLKKPIITESDVTHTGTLLVGTPEQCPQIQALALDQELIDLGPEGYLILATQIDRLSTLVITANRDQGLLYGAFALLRLMQTGADLSQVHIAQKPRIQYRLLNHWDNPDGSVERGYAGRSLWQWDELPQTVDGRYTDYARANASLGINGTVVNNVNAHPITLTSDYLKKLKALSDVFRPYGIRVFLSIRFSSPLKPSSNPRSRRGGIGNLQTADPLDPNVKAWWKDKVQEICQTIPDFGGFLVKANSEGMPGPQDYDRHHADGANMLAEALAPYNGIVMWRAFVYNADTDPDRAKRAYKEFTVLDGQFLPNVFVQAKNGPIDFQPREPIHPLFGAMPKTPFMLELQVTQEYLGHSNHLVYLGTQWKEYLDFDTHTQGPGSTVAKVIDGSLHGYAMTGIAGVANTGSDRNWCGHLFAQANWYAYGRLAWNPDLDADTLADEWIRQTLSRKQHTVNTIQSIMMGSWQACVNYMTPLGLHHIMQAGFHYGPQPSYANAPRQDWTSVYYHRADANGLGFDRSTTGSGATQQYADPVAERFENLATCPEKYLLWFHHVPWDHDLSSGRTLWQELCFRYNEGLKTVEQFQSQWAELSGQIDPELHKHVTDKLTVQRRDAGLWARTCVHYFQQFSKQPIPTELTLIQEAP